MGKDILNLNKCNPFEGFKVVQNKPGEQKLENECFLLNLY